MTFNIISLMPEILTGSLPFGVVGQALQRQQFQVRFVNPRSFTSDIHHTVDDRPFGGGDGMVLKNEPMRQAIESLGQEAGHRVLLSAHGQIWNNAKARQWAEHRQREKKIVTLVCGRYGGFDQRFVNTYIDEEISIGDFILSGGEYAALVIIDSTVRFLPGVLGNAKSCESDSFADGLLEAPLFTRPQDLTFDAGIQKVPAVFLNGDHKRISQARRVLSLAVTKMRRPDLWSEKFEQEFQEKSVFLRSFSHEDLITCGFAPEEIRNLHAE